VSEKRLSLWQWQKIKNLPQLFGLRVPPPDIQLARIRTMERNVGLPVKAAVLVVLFYFFFLTNWVTAVTGTTREPLLSGKSQRIERLPAPARQTSAPHERVVQIIPPVFLAYLLINGAYATLMIGMANFSLKAIQRMVFVNCLIDACFFSFLTLVTDGFDSALYWVFLLLIVRNTISIPSAVRQLVLNLGVSASYLLAGMADFVVKLSLYNFYNSAALSTTHSPDLLRTATSSQYFEGESVIGPWNEPFLLRLLLLILVTICCYGVQVLMEKQRRVEEEAREFQLRQEQLQATGRLAAEIAHQLKNPLGIINNAAYTLQKTVKEGKTITQQIRIIREEVERSDRIITELMGYARLSEGQVEKLEVTEELDRALEQVFPPGAKYEVRIGRDYAHALPVLLAQRAHLSEVFVNILQNAREAMDGRGQIDVTAKYGDNYSIIITIRDNGPGIPADKLPKIFEPYFTTKEKGTGLGLAIVKHNTELYNGTVEVQSELGKGTTFVVRLPAKTVFTVRK
jgi:signal transduction histidine kinase